MRSENILPVHLDSDYYLGSLCARNHNFNGTGNSLRSVKHKHCVECKKLALKNYSNIEAKRRAAEKFRKSGKRKPLTDEQKKRQRAKQKEWRQRVGYTEEERKRIAKSQYKYKLRRMKEDEQFAIRERLRGRLSTALRRYYNGKKVASSKDVGIDWKAIAEYLGPCPGERKDFEIDHIKPLRLFDLTNKDQILLAFAPNNHQWLPRKENRSKGSRYNEDKVETV